MGKFSNATFFRQIVLQNLQRKTLGFSETEVFSTAKGCQGGGGHYDACGIWRAIMRIVGTFITLETYSESIVGNIIMRVGEIA